MRFRTILILTVLLTLGMYILPEIVRAVFLPALEQGRPNPVPEWEQILISIAVFCKMYQWVSLLIVWLLVSYSLFTRHTQRGFSLIETKRETKERP